MPIRPDSDEPRNLITVGRSLQVVPVESRHETERRVLPVVGPKPPPERLTLTPPALRSARARAVLARGAGKAQVVRRALEDAFDPRALPAQLARDGTWILDPAAAAALTEPLTRETS